MADTRNALAELAKRLDIDKMHETKMAAHVKGNDIRKAHRIVAELAKVKDIKEFGVVHVREDMAIDAVDNCRAIAEEGEKDGK